MLGKVELEEGETIILEARATCKRGLMIEYGTGQAYLTNHRIIWISGIPSLLLMLIPWIPAVLQIRRDRISRVQLMEDWTRAWIVVEAGSKTYTLRLGAGPAPLLQRNPETTKQWYDILRLREGEPAMGSGKLSSWRKSGILLILLFVLGAPLWIVSFIISEQPWFFFAIMSVLTVSAVAMGLSLSLGLGEPRQRG